MCGQAEFYACAFTEGVGAAMGDAPTKGSGKGRTTSLNRRGAAVAGSWDPLIWAAKDNNICVAEQLLRDGYDVNEQEDLHDKTHNGYSALHWAAHKGWKQMLEMLLAHGASTAIRDKHGRTPQALAETKGHEDIIKILEAHNPTTVKKVKTADGKGDVIAATPRQ